MIAGMATRDPVIQTRAFVINDFFSYLSEIKPHVMLEIKPQKAMMRA